MRRLPAGSTCYFIRLDAPRSNALEPILLTQLQSALKTVIDSDVELAVLCGGKNFSTGGDVRRFHEAANAGTALGYSESVVTCLQECLYQMIASPVLFGVGARGAITGGAAGFVFAADLSVLSPEAFLQPYYGTVGFAPDGGWTAMLPDRIGIAAAQKWLMTDRRVSASEAVDLAIAAEVDNEPEDRCGELLSRIDTGSALATKALLWNGERLDRVRKGLFEEAAAFYRLIGSDTMRSKMASFLGKEEITNVE